MLRADLLCHRNLPLPRGIWCLSWALVNVATWHPKYEEFWELKKGTLSRGIVVGKRERDANPHQIWRSGSSLLPNMGLWDAFLNWLRSLFFKQEMELSLIGLQSAGKTSLVNVIATGGYSEDMIPTVGFNMRKVTRGNVTIKLWDLGGQPRFRSMWERYCRGVSAIVYVVDAADRESIPISKSELHDLLSKPSLNGIPLLVLGNKIDKQPEALSKQALIDQMSLSSLTDREVCCYMISCKNSTNIDAVIDWLVKHSKTKS
ncbi:hypothetical protein GOP47_0008471 [Adiantum capillus-veneris]|uniref:Uncharacterized protein n=1 Tax=Adiantum capillus-veneris TaxID=13818 RepID=A0A9D4ZKG6_ADICA|nr:hypothetical protein GOP47_0008471 [Adiantum capillus-veneris]